jgi:hypothetical protein
MTLNDPIGKQSYALCAPELVFQIDEGYFYPVQSILQQKKVSKRPFSTSHNTKDDQEKRKKSKIARLSF